jgi:hypothetical protein
MLRAMDFARYSMDVRCSPPRAAAEREGREDEESYLDEAIDLDLIDDSGNDDQESTGLDVGEEIEDLLAESVGDNEPIELDLGAFVGADERARDDADDHDIGIEVDPAVGLDLPDALLPDDGSEGIDDGAITVDESKFPSLESDDGSEGIAAERAISLGSASDEAPVPLAPIAWRVLQSKATFEACVALAANGQCVVAGSSDLLWFRGDESAPLRLAVDGSALTDLVLLGRAQDIALAATRSGQLFRRARFASQAEHLSRFRDQHKPAPGARAGLFFGGSLGSIDPRVLLASQDGALFDVLEGGDRFERLELPGKAVALARESATLLIAQGKERLLYVLAGAEHTQMPLCGAELIVARGPAPLLSTCGDTVALADFAHAITVSRDRGRTFQRISGTANATALAGASIAGEPRFFAAIYRETSDQSEILLLDPASGEALCIARLDGESGPTTFGADPVDRSEWAKVARLIWHAESERLWAVGGFGVLSFAAPVPASVI